MKKGVRARWRRWFERKRRKAKQVSDNPEEAAQLAERADQKARRQGKLRQAWDDLQALIRLVRAWARGEYREVSRSTMVLVLAALAYFVSPIDAILDGLPLVGYLDDAAIIGWVVSEVRAELDAFRAWESRSKRLLASASI
jgi:uncharacterized membrane protein YkvA (DUF1232 family)